MKTKPFLLFVCFLSLSISITAQITWPNKVRVHYQTASGQIIDNILIRFSSDPTVTTEESFYWDARSLNCCTFIASMKGNTNLAIQTRPLNFVKDSVKLRIQSTTWGNFKLVFTDFLNFSQAKEVWLVDAFTGMRQEVKSNSTYYFSITSDANSQGTERFKLVFVAEQLVIECPNNIVMNSTFGRNGADVLFSVYAPIAKCSNPIINFSHAPGSFFPIGNTIVNINASDLCGNTYHCSFTVTVTDIEPPMIVAPLPVTHTTDAGTSFYTFIPTQPAITDNNGSVTVTSVRSDGALLSDPYPIGITTISWQAVDAAGNQTTAVQLINITDDESPIISAPPISLNTVECSVTINDYLLNVADNAGNVNLTGVRSDGAALNESYYPGNTTITWTATDASGNTANTVQTISVKDIAVPVITPASINELTINATSCTYRVTGNGLDATASDNCSGVVITNNITNTNTLDGASFNTGNTTVIWTAVDAAGNTSYYNQVVVVTAPSINVSIADAACMTSGVLPNTLYIGYNLVSEIAYTAATDVTGLTYSWTGSSGLIISTTSQPGTVKISVASSAPAGIYQLTLTATNTTGCSFITTKMINVVDIRCDNKLDKISICSPTGTELCVRQNALTGYLRQGYNLGSCNTSAKATSRFIEPGIRESSMKIYPNPANGIFQLQLNNHAPQNATLLITDMFGKAVLQQSIRIQGGDEGNKINISHIAAGMYNVQLITKEGVKLVKLVVVK